MKVTYIICSLIFDLAAMVGALVSPVWVTPGYYYWSVILMFLLFVNSFSFSERINRWEKEK